MNIYIGNLSSDATDETIREAFVSFGQVTSARVVKDKYMASPVFWVCGNGDAVSGPDSD